MKAVVIKTCPIRTEIIENVNYYLVTFETEIYKNGSIIMFDIDQLYFTSKEDADKIVVGYEFEA